MQPELDTIRQSYDAAAAAYAEHLARELEQKPLDRHLLNRFAEETRGRGLVADVGCGPGQVGAYLNAEGVTTVGIDLSPEMIRVARETFPGLQFHVGDMRHLDLDDESLGGIVAFYSIVHAAPEGFGEIFREMRRVLAPEGLALIAFHVGDEIVHVDDLYGAPVSLDFRFHLPERVVEAMTAAGLRVIEQTQREPYEGAEVSVYRT